jgi:hypothetical protein
VHEHIRQRESVFNIFAREHRKTCRNATDQRNGVWFRLLFRQQIGVDKHRALLGRIPRDQPALL